MIQLYLVRHGESVTNTQRLVCGQTDTPLTQRGETQARALSNPLQAIGFNYRYSSTLERAWRTTELAIGLDQLVKVPELKEMNTGDYSLLTVDELYRLNPQYRFQGRHSKLRYPGGECFDELYQRITQWYHRESARWEEGSRVLIVGHEASVCCILHDLFKIPVDSYPTFLIKNCEMVRVDIERINHQVRLQFMSGGSND